MRFPSKWILREKRSSKPYNPGVSTVIAISRSYGAGGRTVGRQVAAQLGIPFYDKNLLASVAQKSGLSVQYLASIDEKAAPSFETIYTLDQSEPRTASPPRPNAR